MTTVRVAEPGEFHWGDAGIGAAATLGAVLAGVGGALAIRSPRPRHGRRPHAPYEPRHY